MLVLFRLYRHHLRGGMSRRLAFSRALATVLRDLNLRSVR